MKILFIDGTGGFSPRRLEERPTGGIITSLTLIPRYLAKMGHEVVVKTHHGVVEDYRGVHYTNGDVSPDFDVVVFNRNSINRHLTSFFKNAYKVWWLHDIVDYRYLEDNGYENVQKIVALSRYCQASYADFYGIPEHLFEIIPNGVDKKVFFPNDYPRDKNLFVYASAPIKGTLPLEFTLHQIKRHNSNAELRLYSSQSLHDLEDGASIKAALNTLAQAGASLQTPIPQEELAGVFRRAWALLMPNHYPEINSNILLQARACGLPVVASNIGSASEFIQHRMSGLLTKTKPEDMFWWFKDFAEQVVTLQHDEGLHDWISRNAPSGVLSWEQIGEKWNEMVSRVGLAAKAV